MLYGRDSGLPVLDQEGFLSNLGKWGQNNQIREVKVGVIQTGTWKELTQDDLVNIFKCLTILCSVFV